MKGPHSNSAAHARSRWAPGPDSLPLTRRRIYLFVTIDLESLPEDVESLKELVRGQRALIASREIEATRARVEIEKLRLELARLRRMKCGRSSGTLTQSISQLELLLEDNAPQSAAQNPEKPKMPTRRVDMKMPSHNDTKFNRLRHGRKTAQSTRM